MFPVLLHIIIVIKCKFNQYLTKIVSKSIKESEYMYAILYMYISEVANEKLYSRSLNNVCSKVQTQHSFKNKIISGWQILQG